MQDAKLSQLFLPPPRRWHPEEEKNDPEFAKQLAEGCDM